MSRLTRSAATTVFAAVVGMSSALARPAEAAISMITYLDARHSDQLSLDGSLSEEDTAAEIDQRAGAGIVGVGAELETTYGGHQYVSTMSAAINQDTDVHLAGSRTHDLQMTGIKNTTVRWVSSTTYIHGHAAFSDTVTLQAGGTGLPLIASLSFVFSLDATNTQIFDVLDDEEALYRLKDQFRFKANATGSLEPVDVDVTTWDPAAKSQNPPMWGVLKDDVDINAQPVAGVSGTTHVLEAHLLRTATGEYMPVDLETTLTVESSHDFLNDAGALSSFLFGQTIYRFSESADLLGVIVRDETGAIRTDVTLLSAAGVSYTLIPEPSSCAGVLATASFIFGVRSRGARATRELGPPLP